MKIGRRFIFDFILLIEFFKREGQFGSVLLRVSVQFLLIEFPVSPLIFINFHLKISSKLFEGFFEIVTGAVLWLWLIKVVD